MPEERVRLRIIESLIRSGWSKHRISTEEAIGELGDTAMRTDIICYNQEFEPRLLVECKAEHIPITAKTAEQVARYNHKVGAPYVLMTNGVTDYWYAIEGQAAKIKELEARPKILSSEIALPDYSLEEWQNRGFMGSKASPGMRKWFNNLLPAFWLDGKASIRFLSFSNSPSDVDLNHYYRLESLTKNRRLALTTINTAFGGNRMIVILNKENENQAVLEINLDVLFAGKKGNSSMYSKEGIRTFDLDKYFNIRVINKVGELAEQVDQLFVEHIG